MHSFAIFMHMRTTLNIDDALLKKASKLTGISEKHLRSFFWRSQFFDDIVGNSLSVAHAKKSYGFLASVIAVLISRYWTVSDGNFTKHLWTQLHNFDECLCRTTGLTPPIVFNPEAFEPKRPLTEKTVPELSLIFHGRAQ